jgi:hypothetical protein
MLLPPGNVSSINVAVPVDERGRAPRLCPRLSKTVHFIHEYTAATEYKVREYSGLS